jgi:hypothetical protein
MSFLPFPEIQAINVFESNESKSLAGVTFPYNMELKNVRAALYFHGNFANETLTLELHGHQLYDSLIASSEVIVVPYSNWIGLVRFDFSNVPVSTSKQYWLKLKTAGYTRNMDTKYLGFVQDFPYPTHAAGVAGPYNPAKVECYGIRR